jgi:hypothetical protein
MIPRAATSRAREGCGIRPALRFDPRSRVYGPIFCVHDRFRWHRMASSLGWGQHRWESHRRLVR